MVVVFGYYRREFKGYLGTVGQRHDQMLKNFFTLDTPFSKFLKLADLENHFKTSSSLENILFEPPRIVLVPNDLFRRRTFKNVSFSKTTFDRVTITECSFIDCLFIGTRFVDSHFHRCTFKDCNTHRIRIEDCYIDPNSFQLREIYKTTHSNVGVWLFHELYRNSKNEVVPHCWTVWQRS